MSQTHKEILKNADEERDDCGTEDGAHHKGLAYQLKGHAEQQQIADILGDGHRHKPSCAEIYQCADTRQTADHNLVRQDKGCETYTIQQQAKDNHDIILGVVDKGFVDVFCHKSI